MAHILGCRRFARILYEGTIPTPMGRMGEKQCPAVLPHGRNKGPHMLPSWSELILSITHAFKGGVPKPPPPPKPPLPTQSAANVEQVSNRRKRTGFSSTILTQGMTAAETTKKTLLGG